MILSRYVFRAVARQVLGVSGVLLLIVVVLQFTRVLARAAAPVVHRHTLSRQLDAG